MKIFQRCPALLVIIVQINAASCIAQTPTAKFDEAIRLDLDGKPELAFASYYVAAETGLPEAEFNVAVMLDSGRGVAVDTKAAALWYARAAAHGSKRAAYNLGQLYEAGEGVPRNQRLARTWFLASKLPASLEHLTTGKSVVYSPDTLTAPTLLAPIADNKIASQNGAITLVWTSAEQPEDVDYFVELRAIDAYGSQEIFAKSFKASSAVGSLKTDTERYAWRVSVIAQKSGNYLASEWENFNVNELKGSGKQFCLGDDSGARMLFRRR